MGLFSKSKEKQPDFDVTKMSDPKFVEFMHNVYKDTQELDPESDLGTISERYKAFENEKKVVSGLDRMYSKQLAGYTNVDSDERQKAIREYIDQRLAENPESVNEIADQLKLFEASEKLLDEQKKNLKKFQAYGGVEGLQEKKAVLERAQGSKSWFKSLFVERPDEAARRAKEEYKVSLDHIDTEIEKVQQLLTEAKLADKQIGMMKQEFVEIRTELLAGLEIAEKLAEMGRQSLQKEMTKLQNDFDTKPLSELKTAFADLADIRNEKDGRNMVFSNDDEFAGDYDDFMEKLDKKLQDKLILDLGSTIQNTNLGELERSLMPYFKQDRVGSMSTSDARQNLRAEMERAAYDSATSQEKRFLLKVLLLKHEYFV